MSTKLYHAYTKEPGFFVHSINSIYGGLPCHNGTRQKMKSYQLESAASEEINSLDKFCLIIPVRQGIIGALSSILSQAVVKAIDEKRCVLAFDFSNEAGNILQRDELSESLSAFGIKNLEGCWLLCQNRLIPSI